MAATGDDASYTLTLLYNYYEPGDNPTRKSEIEEVCGANLANARWQRIIIAIENMELAERVKKIPTVCRDVRFVLCRRPTYRWWFELAESYNENLHIVLVNSDIYVPPESAEKISRYEVPLALQRYECDSVKNLAKARLFVCPRCDSQDTWAFRVKKDVKHDWALADFNMGVPGCDNRVAWILDEVFKTYGDEDIIPDLFLCTFTVKNPCYTIKTYHIHKVREPYKDDRIIAGPYKYVVACD
jgi:hypothetical protein